MKCILGSKNILGIFDNNEFSSLEERIEHLNIKYNCIEIDSISRKYLITICENERLINYYFINSYNEIFNIINGEIISCNSKVINLKNNRHSLICKIFEVPTDFETLNNLFFNMINGVM